MKDFSAKTTKKVTKIYGSNTSGLNVLLASFQALTANKLTLDNFAKQLSFATPTELDVLPIIRRHLTAGQQLAFAEHCHRVPTRPRVILLRLATNEKAGFRLRERRIKSKTRFFISYVETHSRSSKSGLRVGDEILSINGAKLNHSTMTEVQMIFLNAMRSYAGAKLKTRQIGFVPNEANLGWLKIDGYQRHTRELAVAISLSDNCLFGCTVSDCRPGLFITRIIEGGVAARVGLEPGDKIIEIDGHHVEKTHDTDAVGALLRQRRFDLVVLRADRDQLEKLVVYFERQGKSNKDKETVLPGLQSRLEILTAQSIVTKHKASPPILVEEIEVDTSDELDTSSDIQWQLTEILDLLAELDKYLDSELAPPKKARLANKTDDSSNDDVLDGHFERANMARFMLARQSVLKQAQPPHNQYVDTSEVIPEKVARQVDEIIEVYSQKQDETRHEPECDHHMSFETVGSSKSSIRAATSVYYGVQPVNKLQPVSSDDEEDNEETFFEPDHRTTSSPIFESESEHDDFFDNEIRIDHFNKSQRPMAPRLPSLGPASLTITSEPSVLSQTRLDNEPEAIPRTFVAAKIARLNHSASQKKNSPIVLRKPSLNQKTKRSYGHVAKPHTTKQYTLEEFKQLNVTFYQADNVVYLNSINSRSLANVCVHAINGINVSKMPVSFLRLLVANFPRRGVKTVELIYS